SARRRVRRHRARPHREQLTLTARSGRGLAVRRSLRLSALPASAHSANQKDDPDDHRHGEDEEHDEIRQAE
ncbi:hypothetical protein, partial [Mesorhizobium japonicum]|uniref:hypothetical protein n=1 Tax=Mesorhizobium japonicum TaxID=2066070 RepID=UPI003B58FF58